MLVTSHSVLSHSEGAAPSGLSSAFTCLWVAFALTFGAFLNVRTSCIGGASIFFPSSNSPTVIRRCRVSVGP